jgi:hypothetical protein
MVLLGSALSLLIFCQLDLLITDEDVEESGFAYFSLQFYHL